MIRILKNLSEHLLTFRSLTATRLRLEALDLTPEEIKTMYEKVSRLSADNRTLVRQIEKNSKQIDSYQSRIAQYREEIAELTAIVDLQRKSYVGITRQLAKRPDGDAAAPVQAPADDPFLDLFDQELEDYRRGSGDEIKHRLRVYLPYLDFLADRKNPKVVDLGSGRGEWLDLLHEQGVAATGVFARQTQAPEADDGKQNVDIVLCDPLSWLHEQKDRSVDLVTAFHIIERMPFDRLAALLKEVLRVLKPGGKIILETPNPESLVVGAHKFWLDPARIRPLPPELMEQLMHSLAFDAIEVMRLHPDARSTNFRDRDGLPQELCNLIAGSDDYAIIGERR